MEQRALCSIISIAKGVGSVTYSSIASDNEVVVFDQVRNESTRFTVIPYFINPVGTE